MEIWAVPSATNFSSEVRRSIAPLVRKTPHLCFASCESFDTMNLARTLLAKRPGIDNASSQWRFAVMAREIGWALAATLLATLVAWHALGFSFLRSGVPALYVGDAIQYAYIYQATREDGWNQPISRAGAPFGTSSHDFPNADGFNLLLTNVLGFFADDPFAIFNLYVFATFVICGLVAYAVFRRLGLDTLWAAVASIVFNLIPFHFHRLGHLFYLMYVIAALAAWLALEVVYEGTGGNRTKRSLALAAALICGATGVYYAFFSCVIVAAAMLCAAAASGTAIPVRRGSVVIALIVATTAVNLVPPLWASHQEGGNREVAARDSGHSEIYGLKLTQLLLPRLDYRVPYVANIRAAYERSAPLSNENSTASLGLIGAFGFLALLSVPFLGRWNERVPPILQRASGPTYAAFFYATIGGFGSLFAFLVTPQLRGLNRISPFIAFLAILAALALVGSVVSRWRARWIRAAIALLLIGVCLFDQVAAGGRRWEPYYSAASNWFDRDRRFFTGLEKELPAGAMLLQLPLIPYPEEPPRANLGSYDLSAAYLHTKTLRWTFGAMRGRPEDLWQRIIGKFPLPKQIAALRDLGFSGIVVDRRGYEDQAKALDGAFVQEGLLSSESDDVHEFFPLPDIRSATDRAFAVAPIQGWSDIRATSDGAAISGAGRASLLIGNVDATANHCRLDLTMEAVGASRTISVWTDGRKISENTLAAGQSQHIVADIDVSGGRRKIDLLTDAPADAVAYTWLLSEVPLCR